jgi:tetratricopeptide (TPR) repeat protein
MSISRLTRLVLPLLLLFPDVGVGEPPRSPGAGPESRLGALIDAAFALHKAGRFPEAGAAYRRAIAALELADAGGGGSSQAHALSLCLHNLAYLSAHELGDLDEARRRYAQATRVRPDYFEAYHNLGQALLDRSLFSEAIEMFAAEASIRPDLAAPRLAMASCYQQLGSVDAAGEQALHATALDPSSTAAFNGAGWFLHLAGRSRDADAVLKRGIRLHPANAAMHFHRGKALSDLGNAQLAAKVLKRSVKLDPSNSEAFLLLGMAYFTRGDLSDASESVWRKCARALEQALERGVGGETLRDIWV